MSGYFGQQSLQQSYLSNSGISKSQIQSCNAIQLQNMVEELANTNIDLQDQKVFSTKQYIQQLSANQNIFSQILQQNFKFDEAHEQQQMVYQEEIRKLSELVSNLTEQLSQERNNNAYIQNQNQIIDNTNKIKQDLIINQDNDLKVKYDQLQSIYKQQQSQLINYENQIQVAKSNDKVCCQISKQNLNNFIQQIIEKNQQPNDQMIQQLFLQYFGIELNIV